MTNLLRRGSGCTVFKDQGILPKSTVLITVSPAITDCVPTAVCMV